MIGLPGFRTSLAQSDALHVQGRVGYVLHKGGPKEQRKKDGRTYEVMGRDLGNAFRFVRKTDEPTADRETGELVKLDELFSTMPFAEPPGKDRPFPTARYIPIRILGFDHLSQYDPVQNRAAIEQEVSRWARWTAHAASMSLARTDPFGRYLVARRINGIMVGCEPGEVPTPVTLNAPGEAYYDKNLANGLECYLHEGKLYPWTAAGELPLHIPELTYRGGLTCYGKLITTSKYDINSLTQELQQIVIMACNMGAKLSQLPVILYREEQEISAVNFDQSKPIGERRAKKQAAKKWLVHIKLEAQIVHALMDGARVQEQRFLQQVANGGYYLPARASREEALDKLNADLGLPARQQAPARPKTVIVQDNDSIPAPPVAKLEEAGDSAEDIAEGEFEEGDQTADGEPAKAVTPERPWLAKVIAAADAPDFTAFFVAEGNIAKKEARQAAWKGLGLSKEKTATPIGRAEAFVVLCLWGEALAINAAVPADYVKEQVVDVLRGIELPEKVAHPEQVPA